MDKPYHDNYNDYNDYNNTGYVDYELPGYSIFILLIASSSGVFYGLCKVIANNCIQSYKKKKALKIKTVDSNDEENLLNECSICIEKYKKHEKIIILECDHNFHEKCIKEWLNNKNSCPNCRENIY